MSGPGARLLLIQGDDEQRQRLCQAMADIGYTPDVIEGTEAELQALSIAEYDAIFLDLHLPHYNGHDVLHVLTQVEDACPVVVVCRKRVMKDVLEALRYGASDYLKLPVTETGVLQHALENALAQGGLRRENEAYRRKLEAANRDLLESLTHLQQDQQAGRHIQVRMLPENPKAIGSYRFCHFVLPSLYLSGDFVDYFAVGEQSAVFLVADVSGHGASSAFVTVMLKNLFARKRSDYMHRNDHSILSPSVMLSKANNELLAMDIGKHVTMCVGTLNLDSGELQYSVAGHLPAPVLSNQEGARYLNAHDMPVGLFEDAEFPEERLVLAADDVLTLFTDGILEVVSEATGLLEKEEKLLDLLCGGHHSAEEVFELFGLASVTDAPDDIAALVIARS